MRLACTLARHGANKFGGLFSKRLFLLIKVIVHLLLGFCCILLTKRLHDLAVLFERLLQPTRYLKLAMTGQQQDIPQFAANPRQPAVVGKVLHLLVELVIDFEIFVDLSSASSSAVWWRTAK